MWAAKERRHNLYLQRIFKSGIGPVLLNRSLSIASQTHNISIAKKAQQSNNAQSAYDKSLPIGRLSFCPELVHVPIAFGRLGVPLLITGIQSQNRLFQIGSLNYLAEELVDDKKCYRAIIHLEIVKRLANTLHEEMDQLLSDDDLIKNVCSILKLIGEHLIGAEKISESDTLLNDLFSMIVTNEDIRPEVIQILATISKHHIVATRMIETAGLARVYEILSTEDRIDEMFYFLANLIRIRPAQAMAQGFFDIILPRISIKQPYQSKVMKCFALLIQCPQGQQQCDKNDVVYLLSKIICDDTLDLSTLEYATMAIQNCTLSTRSRWRARELWDLLLVLIKRAHCKRSERMQMFALQALRQLTEMPSTKNWVRLACKSQIKNICGSQLVLTYKNALLNWLEHNNTKINCIPNEILQD